MTGGQRTREVPSAIRVFTVISHCRGFGVAFYLLQKSKLSESYSSRGTVANPTSYGTPTSGHARLYTECPFHSLFDSRIDV